MHKVEAGNLSYLLVLECKMGIYNRGDFLFKKQTWIS